MRLLGEKTEKYLDFSHVEIAPFGTPIPLHGSNPRNMLGKKDWDLLRKVTYERFHNRCAICGDNGLKQGFSHRVEAHEKWDYDFDNEIQYFDGLIALCPICHKIYHWDQTRMLFEGGKITKKEYQRIQALRYEKMEEVNGTSIIPEPKYPNGHGYRWHHGNWKSDFSILKEMGFKLLPWFDTKWNGIFELDENGYYVKSKEKPVGKGF